MGPKSGHIIRHRGIIRATQSRRWINVLSVLILAGTMTAPAYAGDILRGGATRANDAVRAQALANTGQAQALKLRANAQDRLARTTQTLQSMQAAQAAARSAAAAVNDVGNGLRPGGLEVLTGENARWDGAETPVAAGNDVTIKQNDQQAVLHWKTFNVGRDTTVNFDQSKGGADAGKWIAFNKVFDPSAAPSQIRGRINAQGQVYILNQNGIVFSGSSQINTRALVASSLPINDNLVRQGLLNNRDSQFIFSTIEVPGGSDGTPAFIPPAPPAGGRYGDVIVQRGAQLRTSVSAEGGGGRVMLVGPNVQNEGTIETPAGQTILAAGHQVGMAPHSSDDPSLRGLDVWVGRVENGSGTVVNSGIIRSLTGSITVAGKRITQAGALESSTSVALNGRIDLLASYGAVANPNFDNDSVPGFRGPVFFNQYTGVAEFTPGSVTRILPQVDGKRIPGAILPERSRVNIEGLAVHFGPGSILSAPNGEVNIRAGSWPYRDQLGNPALFDALETAPDPSKDDAATTALKNLISQTITQLYSGSQQLFLHDEGQVYFDRGSLVDVSGSTTAFVPISQSVVGVSLRGNELADSPLLRNSSIRGVNLTVDLQQSGDYFGRYWIGTPLGDLTGILNVIERDVAQLSSAGGDIRVRAGESIVLRRDAVLDVSGGVLEHEGGFVQTTRLMDGRRLVDVSEATPDRLYEDVYTGLSTVASRKWGVAKTYALPLAPLGGGNRTSYLSGAPGGSLDLTASSLALEGELLGRTMQGPSQLDSAERGSRLALNLLAQQRLNKFDKPENDPSRTLQDFKFVDYSPASPAIRLQTGKPSIIGVPEFVLAAGETPEPLPLAIAGSLLLGSSLFDDEEGGFSELTIDNREGSVTLAGQGDINLRPSGKLRVESANIVVATGLRAPGGTVSLVANNYSPFLLAEQRFLDPTFNQKPAPTPLPGRGVIAVGAGARIDVSGQWVDHRRIGSATPFEYASIDAGDIIIQGYGVSLPRGSSLAASGGLKADAFGDFYAGLPGSISVLAGRDPVLSTSIGGDLLLQADLAAYGVKEGGSLTVQANRVQIGGETAPVGGLLLSPSFFQRGGFGEYIITGIGGRDVDGQAIPGLQVAAGTLLEPRTASLTPRVFPRLNSGELLLPVGLRPAARLELEATGSDDAFTLDVIEAVGLLALGEGSRVRTDPRGSVNVKGDVVVVLGTIEAPAGAISVEGGSSFPVPSDLEAAQALALPTVYLGPQSRLAAPGVAVLLPDPYGRRAGVLHHGGSIFVEGNILAEAGAVLDVSGASAALDFHPSRLGISTPYATAGLTTLPLNRQAVRQVVSSDGGRIQLTGSQMLYSDANLKGAAGGSGSQGGTLAVSSGRFYREGVARTSAEINLVVEQSGQAAVFGNTTVYGSLADAVDYLGTGPELSELFGKGSANPGIGYFSLDRFAAGGFGSLDLGYEFRSSASPIAFGGNVQFLGDVRINAPGSVRVAGGGVIESAGQVDINASYVALGREFGSPLSPGQRFQPFARAVPNATGGYSPEDFYLPALGGTGSLSFRARLIDAGTISLQGVGRALLAADGGDIRGNGTLNMVGDMTLRSAQVYPTTLAAFDIFAYDPVGGTGSVTITGSGSGSAPLSAGGSLRVFTSDIRQNGALRAPLGSIVLGWDGTDLDPVTSALDRPQDAISRGGGTVARTVSLAADSTTSVSALGLTIPFGLSPDGLTWIDPRGVDVTLTGLPTRGVTLAGDDVRTASGSVIDLRGGGDLLAYRWIPGLGGSTDLLGVAQSKWGEGATYEGGQLVTHDGATYSARVNIDPADFATPPKPGEDGRYWTLVPESYAAIPGFGSSFTPYAPFNSGATKDPGYVAPSLRLGEQFVSSGGGGLAAGTYTLLPSRFALLPGAYLVRPTDGTLASSGLALSSVTPFGLPGDLSSRTMDGGISFVAGNTLNSLHASSAAAPVRRLFAVMAPDLVAQQASYELYTADSFMSAASVRQNAATVQRLPQDAAPMVLSGNASLSLAGTVWAAGAGSGRAADIDMSSASDLRLVGGRGAAAPGAINLNTSTISAWGAGRLLVGGVRRTAEDGSTVVDVRTPSVTLDNPGGTLTGADVALVSRGKVELTAGSALAAQGAGGGGAYQVAGDGAALRALSGTGAALVRQGEGASVAPLLSLGSGSSVSGAEVVLDSTYGMDVDDSAGLNADRLSLAAGQISLVLSPQSTLAGGLVSPHLVLEGGLLARVQNAKSLSLASYRSIDIYGNGQFGRAGMEAMALSGAGLRGYGQSGAGATLLARDLFLGNPSAAAMTASPAVGGNISLVAGRTVTLGADDFAMGGFAGTSLVAPGGFIVSGSGALASDGSVTITAPLVTGADRASYNVRVAGDLALVPSAGIAGVAPGLGATLSFAGRNVTMDTLIDLPGGLVSLRATTGDVNVGGSITVDGRAVDFHDLTRFAGAGRIDLLSENGDLRLAAGSRLTADGATGGGDAGTISLSAAQGEVLASGVLQARAGGTGAGAGHFVLDARELPSYAGLRDILSAGGFSASQSLRLRSGSVVLDGTTRVRDFSVAADGGDITVTGTIDASGETGGRIHLAASGSVVVDSLPVFNAASSEEVLLETTVKASGITPFSGDHFLRVTSGSASGAWERVISSSPGVVTIENAIAGFTEDDSFEIKPVSLIVAAEKFSNAGKGGQITLEAGSAIDGVANANAELNLSAGSLIDLSVKEFLPGSYTQAQSKLLIGDSDTLGSLAKAYLPASDEAVYRAAFEQRVAELNALDLLAEDPLALFRPRDGVPDEQRTPLVIPGSSAFYGQFEGTFHLRAPRVGNDVRIATIGSTIEGGSSVLAEAFRVYQPSGGVMNTALRNQIHADNSTFLGSAGTAGANETAIQTRLLAGSSLDPALLLVAPGVEIANRTGDLVLGLANPTGSTSTAARNEAFTAADWDLSGWRYGSHSAPGVLTLRAAGDLLFNNTLSDGFQPVSASRDNGWSRLWLAPLMTVNEDLPLNSQSWSYRLTAGADLSGAASAAVLPGAALAAGKGSVLVGEFYPAILNSFQSGTAAGQGPDGQTADHIRFVTSSSDSTERGTRYEVIRTGTGDITIHAGREVQLRNQFASIYSAGVATPAATRIFQGGDFVLPVVNFSTDTRHPGQGNLGANQQPYAPQWALAGGDVRLSAQSAIRRVTMSRGEVVLDSTRQLPSNWLYRRGFVDPATGRFSSAGGVNANLASVTDSATSTTWWIDYSNFFQGIGALGGGDIVMTSGGGIYNVDAAIPTTARMAGLDPVTGLTLHPDALNLLEWGGGDLSIRAGGDLSGGVYHVERGKGELFAGGEINSNAARSPSLYLLGSTSADASVVVSQNPAVFDALAWLPATLVAGDAQFRVTARGDVLLGPVVSAGLLPQGLNNKFWYKTHFHNYSPDATVDVLSLGGSVTHRLTAAGPSGGIEPVLGLWLANQNIFAGVASGNNASNFQPWLRLAELDASQYYTALTVLPPTLRSTALAGDINLVGDLNIFPAPSGTVELAAAGAIIGLQPAGRALTPTDVKKDPQIPATVWTSARVNLSDAAPSSLAGVLSPVAYQSFSTVGRNLTASRSSFTPALTSLNASFAETGSYSGVDGSVQVQRALHDASILHRNDPEPLRAYAMGGNIAGFELFSAKQARVLAGRDITDIAFYLQNNRPGDVSTIAAGRDIIPSNAGDPLRVLANSLARANFVTTSDQITLVDGSRGNALVGDIQVAGPGVLEVLAGRNTDLGTGANRADGTGLGITTIGNLRNPFLAQTGAGLVVLTGLSAPDGGPALGLAGSSLDLGSFVPPGLPAGTSQESAAVAALDAFYATLKEVGQGYASTGSYDEGYAAIAEVFGSSAAAGELFTRSRDIRTVRGGDIRIAVPGGSITMASSITGNPLAPPGLVTEYGGTLSILTDGGVGIGRARIFTLRSGDITIWASNGDIAAGSAPRTVVTAPPTRVAIDTTSAEVLTDLGGLATGGGIGSLQLRETDEPSDVVLIAPRGTVDAGDAGIRAAGNIAVAAAQVLNADNISAGGTSAGVPAAAPVAAPNVGGLSSASSSSAATSQAASDVTRQAQSGPASGQQEAPSTITVEVLGYGGGEDREEEREARASAPSSEEVL